MNNTRKTAYLLLTVLAVYVTTSAYTVIAKSKSTQPVSKSKYSNKVLKTTLAKKNSSKKPKTFARVFSRYSSPSFIECDMPDGKRIKATQYDCDTVNKFWRSIVHNNPSSSNAGNNNSNNDNSSHSSSNTPSNPSPTPTSTPTPTVTPSNTPVISSVSVASCTSTSCAYTSTVIVGGTGFTTNTRAKLVQGAVEFSITNAKAQHTGGNGSTQVIMDFYGAPAGTYDLVIYSTTNEFSPVTKSSAVTL
jgi:hypothetical protein